VALQGTFDTFGLADVLRLLGNTEKSGQLHITGEGPEGEVAGDIWIETGRLVDIDTPEPAGSLAEGVFQMLRLDRGEFTFDPDGRSDSGLSAVDVGQVLPEAQAMLGEWTDVRRSLPSLDHELMLHPTLESPKVEIDAEQWAAVVAVADDRSARVVAERLGLGALGLGRVVRDLQSLGLLDVADPDYVPTGHEFDLTADDLPNDTVEDDPIESFNAAMAAATAMSPLGTDAVSHAAAVGVGAPEMPASPPEAPPAPVLEPALAASPVPPSPPAP